MDETTRTAPGEDAETESGRFGRAREYVGTKYNEMRERVEDVDIGAMTDQVRTYVRSNPAKALLISIGVGFLLGMLLRGGKEEDEE